MIAQDEDDDAAHAEETSDGGEAPPTPGRCRTRLDTIDRVRRELARLYLEAKQGRRDVQDASKLANILSIVARMIEGGELERRMQSVEAAVRTAEGKARA